MKIGLFNESSLSTLSPYQVASLRMLSAGIVLLPLAIREFKQIPKKKIRLLALTGLLGSFFPAFLFCIAETKIDSSLAGFLNALTPIMTIVMGRIFFHTTNDKKNTLGVLIAFSGMTILFLAGKQQHNEHTLYAGFVVCATLCYALNVHLANTYLKELGSTSIAAVSFSLLIPPALAVLGYTGYFNMNFTHDIWMSTAASMLLGVLGTAIATIVFYKLMKSAGPVFASMVTYGIPFVALGWGLLAGEDIQLPQLAGLGVILVGVYLANR
jgi:drug/metabolite transporter (DMT)-like permease